MAKIATFLTEWDLLFDILLYIFLSFAISVFSTGELQSILNNPTDLQPYIFWI